MDQENKRNIVEEFRTRTDEEFHKVKGCSAHDFEQAVYDYVHAYMEEYAPALPQLYVLCILDIPTSLLPQLKLFFNSS